MSAKVLGKHERDEDISQENEAGKRQRDQDWLVRTKCELVRKWGKEFQWSWLDDVPIFDGEERHIFTFGKQIEEVLKAVRFPDDVLRPDARVDHDKWGVAEQVIIFNFTPQLEERLMELREEKFPENPDKVGNVAEVTNHCFESPVPEIFQLIWRHSFAEQTREARDEYVPHNVEDTADASVWTDFAAPKIFKPEFGGLRHWAEEGELLFECEHCVLNLVVQHCGVSPSLARIVASYYVFRDTGPLGPDLPSEEEVDDEDE